MEIMSTLRIGTLESLSGSNSVSQTTIFSGTAKTWSNLNGQLTIAARDNFNVSSYTDNGTGDYDVNLSSAMIDANQATLGYAGEGTTQYLISSLVTQTASNFHQRTFNNGGSFFDCDHLFTAIHGDLA